MRVKFVFSMLVTLLLTFTVFPLDAVADTGSASNGNIVLVVILVIVLILFVIICLLIVSMIKERAFLKAHRRLIRSTDPKVLLELSEKCEEYLKKDRRGTEVRDLARQAQHKMREIQREVDFETFKSEISEDGLHPAVVATLKEQMHNPDSFQHVSSHYKIVVQKGKRYQKIVMTFRGRNTFNALVLQTCYFIVDADNQVSLVGSPDDTESSPVNSASLSESIDAAASAFEGIATAVDLLLFFTSDE